MSGVGDTLSATGGPELAIGSGNGAGDSLDDHDVYAPSGGAIRRRFFYKPHSEPIIDIQEGDGYVLKELITRMRQAVELVEVPHYLLEKTLEFIPQFALR
jgi:hypothetical protein